MCEGELVDGLPGVFEGVQESRLQVLPHAQHALLHFKMEPLASLVVGQEGRVGRCVGGDEGF